MNTGRPKDRGPGAPVAALFVVLLVVVAIFAYASLSSKPVTPTSSRVATTSTTQASTSHSSSSETFSTSSASSAATSSTAISRIPDIRRTYAANVALSSSVTTSTGTNTTNTCAASGTPTGQCAGTECPLPSSGRPMELQVVSDTTGTQVQGTPAVSAIVEYGCQGINIDVKVTLFFDRVGEGSSGWFDMPGITGAFNLTVAYAGHTFLFGADAYPESTACLTLAVPSGAVSLAVYQFSNYDCAGNLGAWAGASTYRCFGEVYLRVLSDADSSPAAGVAVTTAYDFPETCGGSQEVGGEAFKFFTTANGTEWYVFGDSANSFSVIYGGEAYDVAASQPSGSTCVTLRVPSGAVDVAYGAGCASPGSSASTTTSTSTTVTTTSSSTNCPSASSSSTRSSTGSSPSISAAEVANVTLTPWPGQIAVNPVAGKIYVSNLCVDALTVLNASSNAVISTIALPGTPSSGILVDPETDMVYVPVSGCSSGCNSSGGIVVVDGHSDAVAGEFPIDVQHPAIDPVRHVLYGISPVSFGSLSVDYLYSYDEDSGTALSRFPLSTSSMSLTTLDMAVNSQSNMVFLSALERSDGSAEVVAVNETSHLVQWTARLGYGTMNFPLVFDPANNSVYVMGETGGNLTLDAIDGLTGSLLYSASLGSSCAGAAGGGLAADTASNRLYAVSDGGNFFLVIDGGTGQLVGTFNTPQSGGGYNIGLNPATHEVYLTFESSSHSSGYFVVLSADGLNRNSQVEPGFLQRGACPP